MAINPVNIIPDNTNVTVITDDKKIVISGDVVANNVNVTQPIVNTIRVEVPGPQGSKGDKGDKGDTPSTASFVQTGSFNQFTSSYYTDSSSFESRIGDLEIFSSSLDNTFATDVELNQATSSLSASISLLSSSFESFSGSYNTGSFSGSFEGNLIGTASYAETASYVNPLAQSVQITGSLNTSGSIHIIDAGTSNPIPSYEDFALSVNANGANFLEITGNNTTGQYFRITNSTYSPGVFAPLFVSRLNSNFYGLTFISEVNSGGDTNTNRPVTTFTSRLQGNGIVSNRPLFDFNNQNILYMRMMANGNLKLTNGTYNSVDNSSDYGYKLDVSGSGRFTDGLVVTGSTNISGSTTLSNSDLILVTDPTQWDSGNIGGELKLTRLGSTRVAVRIGRAAGGGGDDGEIELFRDGVSTFKFSSTNNNYINPTGLGSNLGIGTTSPQAKLHVSGTARFDDVLTLTPQDPLPSGVPTGSFAVSSSSPPKPYFYDGTNWNALY